MKLFRNEYHVSFIEFENIVWAIVAQGKHSIEDIHLSLLKNFDPSKNIIIYMHEYESLYEREHIFLALKDLKRIGAVTLNYPEGNWQKARTYDVSKN